MKKITFLLMVAGIIVTACHCFAQDRSLPKPGEYRKYPELDKFEGTWQWQTDDTVFSIVLEKFIFKPQKGALKGYSQDAIIGWHEYKIGDNVIESSLDHIGEPLDEFTYSLFGVILQGADTLRQIIFHDISKSKEGEAKLSLLPGKKDLARWTLKGTPGVKVLGPGEEPDYTFTVPTDIIMRKIKKKNK